jgi:hypothetical protein
MNWNRLKKFKNQLHLVRNAIEAMSKKDICLNLNLEKDKSLRLNLQLPPKREISLFASVMRLFVDPKSVLNYKNIAAMLFEGGLLTPEEEEQFSERVSMIEAGPAQIQLQVRDENERLSGLDLYKIYSKGEFFDTKEPESDKIKEFHGYPAVTQIMIYSFYSYNCDIYRLCDYLYGVIRKAEKKRATEESVRSAVQQCIYCLTKTGSFKSEEHVYPESLGNDEIVLPPGQTCDDCNNGVLSELDQHIVEHELIAFLRLLILPYNPKSGKYLKAKYQNVTIEKISPREIFITSHNPKMGLDMEENGSQVRGTLQMQGRKKFDPELLGRALYKIALGIVCNLNGISMALDSRYDTAREFILGKRSFPNNLFIKKVATPHAKISGEHHILEPGTFFKIDIFGITFGFNLEPEPLVEFPDEILDKLGFECFSLSE